jgi:hypothetical protein
MARRVSSARLQRALLCLFDPREGLRERILRPLERQAITLPFLGRTLRTNRFVVEPRPSRAELRTQRDELAFEHRNPLPRLREILLESAALRFQIANTLLALGTQPEAWALGVAIVPIGDYIAAFEDEMEPLKRYDAALFGGTPTEVPDSNRRSNPITYIDNVTYRSSCSSAATTRAVRHGAWMCTSSG